MDLSYLQVQTDYPEAWAALPETYKADSCLSFYTECGVLFAEYDLGGTYAFDAHANVWEQFV